MRAQYLLGGEQPSMLTAQNAIRDIKNDSQPVPVTVERIINEVARTFNVSPEDIRSSKRTAQISKARQVAIYVVRDITGLPMKAIGNEFGTRDHSTVVYAIQKVESLMEKDSSYREHDKGYHQKYQRLIFLNRFQHFLHISFSSKSLGFSAPGLKMLKNILTPFFRFYFLSTAFPHFLDII